MGVVSLTTPNSPNFGFKNEFISTLLLAFVSALAYDFLAGVVTNQVILIVIGLALAIFFGGNIVGDLGLGVAMIGIAKYIAKDTEIIASELGGSA